ncbi:MAG: hypothetical protein MJE66_18465, partial [Proteobacteria bacterium]|nr:hypothetical protein [Pseudomonadota bacterium]
MQFVQLTPTREAVLLGAGGALLAGLLAWLGATWQGPAVAVAGLLFGVAATGVALHWRLARSLAGVLALGDLAGRIAAGERVQIDGEDLGSFAEVAQALNEIHNRVSIASRTVLQVVHGSQEIPQRL